MTKQEELFVEPAEVSGTQRDRLPQGWSIMRIDEFSEKPQYGWTTKASNSGSLRLLRTTDMSSGSVNWASVPFCTDHPKDVGKYLLKPGDILVSRAGSVGKSFLIKDPVESVFASYLVRIRTQAEPQYLHYYMQSLDYWNQIAEKSAGIAVPNVNGTKLASLEVPVAPLETQRAIVSKIDELFSDIEAGERALKRARKALERYRKSVLKAAVTGELTADWREANQDKLEPASTLLDRILTARREAWEKAELAKMNAKGKPPKTDAWKKKYKEPPSSSDGAVGALPETPKKWALASMDQLTSKITSGSRDWKKYYGRGEAVFILAQNIRPLRLDLSTVQNVDPPLDDRDALRSAVQPEDVLVTIVGANTGDVCRVTEQLHRHYVCQSVALLRPAVPETGKFLELYLNAEDAGRKQMDRYIYGAGRPHLSFDQLRDLAVPIPSIEEIEAIVERVEERLALIDHVEATLSEQDRRVVALRQSVLKAAFSGQLRLTDTIESLEAA